MPKWKKSTSHPQPGDLQFPSVAGGGCGPNRRLPGTRVFRVLETCGLSSTYRPAVLAISTLHQSFHNKARGLRHQAAKCGSFNQRFLQCAEVLPAVDIGARFQHRAGESPREQIAKHVTKRESCSHTHTAEKASHHAREADQVKSSVGTRTQHSVRNKQFPEGDAQSGWRELWRIRSNNQHS